MQSTAFMYVIGKELFAYPLSSLGLVPLYLNLDIVHKYIAF